MKIVDNSISEDVMDEDFIDRLLNDENQLQQVKDYLKRENEKYTKMLEKINECEMRKSFDIQHQSA